jgi:hypothetical protein
VEVIRAAAAIQTVEVIRAAAIQTVEVIRAAAAIQCRQAFPQKRPPV